MSKTIEILEKMGNDSSLQNEDAIKNLLVTTACSANIAKAIIDKDVSSLEYQLQVRANIVCAMYPAEDDEAAVEDDEQNSEENEENKTAIST
ncbi:hypothetical protein Q4503_10365 [Colwellia sp. 6_MG-2023]|uniref:hypothetical protein n=1 Tax=Colwellia sp. 6_MG-2023 TaxID=3062676 RepID=UPI0026E28E94|nr:hypothetical protein [Colwellia sp. 6_MG-2023]MDO6488104.1 hypothetical protein [Colwellia sp. 6_MG-2023]